MSSSETIYWPLTETAYNEMYAVVNPIKAELPTDGNRLNIIWNNWKLIANSNDPQPCGCKSTVKYWAVAVDTLKSFIQQVELKKEELSSIQINKPTE
jgi:hypothetical protein